MTVGETDHTMRCSIRKGPSGPVYSITIVELETTKTSLCATQSMKEAFEAVGYNPKRKMGGLEFYGMLLPQVLNVIRVEDKALQPQSGDAKW